jgi:hypothetical protein
LAGSWTASPTIYTYRWQRCDGIGCSDIVTDGPMTETKDGYTVQSPDIDVVGDTLRVTVTATNGVGPSTPQESASVTVTATPPTASPATP